MADETPAADGGQPDSGSLETRVGALESGQESLSGKIDQVLAALSGGSAGGGEATPAAGGGGHPDGIAMEIRRQLDERKSAEQAEQAAAGERNAQAREIDSLKSQVAALSERRPEAPVRRVEKFMGWR